MAKIQIDGKIYEVKADRNLLETCLALGFDIPYFCNHPALGSVGACRLCAVKKYTGPEDKKGRIVMSCMEPVTEGMIISVDDPDAKAFRAAVIEGLMTNHPHDCPICDEGGECHLQDMTVMTGHNYRKFDFKKRTYISQYLGPFVHHEMNRCIQCYRCVRFYRDYSGGKDLNVFGSAGHVYFGRQKEGILENDFSGNLIEVCPTGVFTDKTLKRHYARKWDMTNSPSICVHCSLGCNTIVSERYGSVRRIMSRYNGSVNGYFICDRGRFGYEFINNPGRIKNIQIRVSKDSDLHAVNSLADTRLSEALNAGRIIGIGSPRASLEANNALSILVGQENFYHGISEKGHTLAKKAVSILESGIAHSPSLREIEKCDAVLILGEDVSNSAPMMALALRQATRNKSIGIAAKLGIPEWNDNAVREMDQNEKSPVFIASPYTTALDELATDIFYLAPEDIARLGFSVASAITSGAPLISDQDKQLQKNAENIAAVLANAEFPLIVTGLSLGNEELLNASANIALALSGSGKKPLLSIVFPEVNSAGLALLNGKSLDHALGLIENDKVDTVVILENDLYLRVPKERADLVFEKCNQVIVLDHLLNETARRADILLPASTFAGSSGTIVNNEGRAQRYYSVIPGKETIRESWLWLSDMMKMTTRKNDVSWEKFDDIAESLASYPVFDGIREKMPDADFRFFNEKISRQNKRFSGRTAMNAGISVSEPKPPPDPDSPLEFSMEGYNGIPPSSLIPNYWSPGWNSSQSMLKYMDEPDGHLKEGGDPGIRLFNYQAGRKHGYFISYPEKFAARSGELLMVPVNHIFGSEELSSMGEAIAERIQETFLLLNEKEIAGMELTESEKSDFVVNGVIITAVVKKDIMLPDGVAGLSVLTARMAYIDLPAWGKVLKS